MPEPDPHLSPSSPLLASELGPVFLHHPSPMLAIDPASESILAANAAAVRFYGWSEAQLCARHIGDLNTLDPDEISREVEAARRQDRDYFVFRHRTAAGEIRAVEVHSGPMTVAGRPVLVSVIHDATAGDEAVWAVRESEAFARAIVESAPVGIAVADLEGYLLRVNQAMAEITGYREDELVGLDHRLLTHPEDRHRSQQLVADLHAGLIREYRLEKRYLRADGTVAEVQASSTLIPGADGTPRFQLGVVQDLTLQRQAALAAQRAADQLSRTMESVTDGIFILEADWTLTYVNPRFEELLQVTSQEVVGRPLWEAFPAAASTDFHTAYRDALESSEPRTVVEEYPPLGLWFEARAYPSESGLVVYFSDVTERVHHQQRLERIVDAERTNAARLQELDEVKNAFLSAVSHELRTPLSVVSGLAETLTRLRGNLEPAVRDRIEDALLHHSRQLTDLLDELLNLDRLSRGTLAANREALDVAALVRDAVAESEEEGRCDLEVPDHLVASVDRVQVEHLLRNLLSNATKYAPDGPVEVRLRPVGSGSLELAVRDHGPGIPVEDRERVFEPFVRIDHDHPQPGTGVGLALVAEFARLHDGAAWIADVEGPGTEVVVRLAAPGAG